ncbi:acetyltransferase [Undibacterium sp. LX40W]|uniref:Acetyltransferase n=1 Tax=Undibacterium nitidum TaxID=2762298 RepID=A0A923HSI5_9BURK|nr:MULTISPECIES: acetyltransferase [Undibacterium]MBC3881722.1 acetyltransferase [Undibacterium nitidum]MBC3892281.1 acetyltransferase [Undibacterium sp. LX40W]
MKPALVIFGCSNILSDIFDCALANHLEVAQIVSHLPESVGERDRSVLERAEELSPFQNMPKIIGIKDFLPKPNDLYILGPTTPTREVLAIELEQKFGIQFTTLIHPTSYVSPLAAINPGVFIGAKSVIGPGAQLAQHVFINRGVTVGHDTQIGAFSRIQPGSNLGGLSCIGKRVTVGIGATVLERLNIGDDAVVGAGAVVTNDVDANVLVVGIPAKFKKSYAADSH